MLSFGHCVQSQGVDGGLIEDCLFIGTLRPAYDLFPQTVGLAIFPIVAPKERRNEVVIPLGKE